MSLLTDLVLALPLDESSGTRTDVHSGKIFSEIGGTITNTAGKIASAVNFVAANSDYLECPSDSDLETGSIDYTLSFWVYLQTAVSSTILSKRGTALQTKEYVLTFNLAPNRFQFVVYDGSTAGGGVASVNTSGFGVHAIQTWYHLLTWYDTASDLVGIRINDTYEDTVTPTSPLGSTTQPVQLGAQNASGFLNGRIDEFYFWRKLLTAEEKTKMYNSDRGFLYPFYYNKARARGIGRGIGVGLG